MYKIVNPFNMEAAWPVIEPWIRKALDESTAETDILQIKQDALSGISLVILGYHPISQELDVVVVCECKRVGGVPTLVIMWAAGRNVNSWMHDISIIENLARDRGFPQIQVWGRKGWEKLLKSEGYRHEFTVLSKSLDYRSH